jgi:hypothetical protein
MQTVRSRYFDSSERSCYSECQHLELDLYCNEITSVGVRALVDDNVAVVKTLTKLRLSGNRIRCEGATILANALGDNAMPSLKQLQLGYCDIGDDGFVALVSALEQNTGTYSRLARKSFRWARLYGVGRESSEHQRIAANRNAREEWEWEVSIDATVVAGGLSKEHQLGGGKKWLFARGMVPGIEVLG